MGSHGQLTTEWPGETPPGVILVNSHGDLDVSEQGVSTGFHGYPIIHIYIYINICIFIIIYYYIIYIYIYIFLEYQNII